MRVTLGCLLVLFMVAVDAPAARAQTGCCLREFETESGTVTTCTHTTLNGCFQFAGVGLVGTSFAAGEFCAPNGMSCVTTQPVGIDLGLGLGRPPGDPTIGENILKFLTEEVGGPVKIRARVLNQTSSTLTHVTVRIFVGDQEVLNDENVAFASLPAGGFFLTEDTVFPDQSESVAVLVCYATGEMDEDDCPEYPTGITGDDDLAAIENGGAAQIQVFVAQAFGVLLLVAEVRPAPVFDAATIALLAAILLGIEAWRRRHTAA